MGGRTAVPDGLSRGLLGGSIAFPSIGSSVPIVLLRTSLAITHVAGEFLADSHGGSLTKPLA